MEWPGDRPRRAQPGPAARKGPTPETLGFLSWPEVRGDVGCHGNSFVTPAPTEVEAAEDGGGDQWAAAGIFPPQAPHAERADARFLADQRRGATADFAQTSSQLMAVLNTGALAMPSNPSVPSNSSTTPAARPSRWSGAVRGGPAVSTPELGGSAAPDPVPGVTDTIVHLFDPTAGFDTPVIAWFRSGKVASHVESAYGHSADKVRRYPSYRKLNADKYYVGTHGRGPRFTITSHYALALFGRDEVSGGSSAAHLERVGSWDDAVTVVRSAAHGTPVGGGLRLRPEPQHPRRRLWPARSTWTTNHSLLLRCRRWWLTSVVPRAARPRATRPNATIAEQVNQLADAANRQLGAMTGLGSPMAQIAASVAKMKLGSLTKSKGNAVGFSVQPGKQRKDDMTACNERERVAKAKTGIAFERSRTRALR